MKAAEVNFDRLAGPTHHYGGYAYGNLASMEHKKQLSFPKKCALQGLNKMKLLHDLGIPQAVLPPPMRPACRVLRALGFVGSDTQIIEKAAAVSPELFYQLSSSSFMWMANSATVSPSSDTKDGRFHVTIANLTSQFHRSVESEENLKLFRLIFSDEALFAVHPALPKGGAFGDEGAANHTRFCREYGDKGINLFVYNRSAFEPLKHQFPFRQAKEASESIARRHGLDPTHTFFVRQNPEVIEAGVFHNDVISVGNQDTFLYHEKAFIDIPELPFLKTICVTEKMLPLQEAVKSYFFNGQLVTLPDKTSLLVLPDECKLLNLDWLPIKTRFVDVSESMRNGGGPGCLRLRCVLNENERAAIHQPVLLTEKLYELLVKWIEKYYRDSLTLDALTDPALLQESQEALDTLTQILHLGSYYEFQRETTRDT